jgi:hypothetical protein
VSVLLSKELKDNPPINKAIAALRKKSIDRYLMCLGMSIFIDYYQESTSGQVLGQ